MQRFNSDEGKFIISRRLRWLRIKRYLLFSGLFATIIFAAIGFFLFKSSHTEASISPEGSMTSDFSSALEPTFTVNSAGLVKSAGQAKASGELDLPEGKISSALKFNGETIEQKPEISTVPEENDRFVVKVEKNSQFKPGKYQLKVDLTTGDKTQILTQDFTWGVLAINPDKAVYLPGQEASIGMAVLNDQGRMVCDAKVELVIEDPDNQKVTLSTDNQKISISEECLKYAVTNLPDYYTTHKVNRPGEYKLTLSAETKNGQRKLSDHFYVEEKPDFIIKREGPTRIYPPEPYKMKIIAKAGLNYSGPVRETVPKSFEIKSSGGAKVTEEGDIKILTWDEDFSSGETKTFEYEFKAPKISPQFYLLGPLEIGPTVDPNGQPTQSNHIYQEKRQWQIAADAPSQVADGTSAYGTAFSPERKVVRTNLGPNGNRVFTLVTTSNIAIDLYYSDSAEAASPTWTNVGDINADTSTSVPNWEATDMVWDTVNNNLWVVYGCITIADAATYDLKYRRITAIGTTPSLGAETDAMSASATLTYSHPVIAIMGDSGTSKVVFFASEHYNGAATRNIAMRTITLDGATLGTTRVLNTAWTASATSGILGVSRMNTDKLVLYYYNGTNILATRHDDSADVDVAGGWDDLAGGDTLRTTVSADDPGAAGAGSIAGDTDSNTIWFAWVDGAYDINTRRWNGTGLDGELVPVTWASANWVVGPALSTDGTTLYMIYQKASDASVLVYQSRTFSDGTNAWSGSETTIEDSAETSVTYPSISRDMIDKVIDVVFTTTTNYYIRHAMINTNSAPTLTVTEPNGTGDTVNVGDTYNIYYDLTDADNIVTVAMYYDSNGTGLDGTAITGPCAAAGEGSGVFCTWDTTGMTPGNYYVYGITKDPSHVWVTDYSPGMITIQSGNTAPNSPTSLVQKKVTGGATLATGDWTNETQVQFTATASDTDNPDTLYLCVEKDYIETALSSTDGGDLCGNGVAYSGTPVTVSVTITGMTDAKEYHWQAQVKDTAAAYSSFVGYGGNTENPPTNPAARDFGTDTTAPTGGSVYDGVSGDQDWNDGSLTQISGNWTGINSNASGLLKYEYAIRRQSDSYYWSVCSGAGTWQAGANWCDNTTNTSFTQNNLNFQTGMTYYISVRTTDVATNVSTPINSNGQQVLPTLSFSYDTNTITFADLNNTNNWTDSKTNIFTTSTNATSGYTIKGYITQLLTSLAYPSITIPNFSYNGASWAAPQLWPAGQYGFGYTSTDTSVQGSNRFLGATLFAPFLVSSPGDIVADHTDAVNGFTGAVSGEQFTVTYKAAVSQVQAASQYQTTAIYIVTANY